MTFGSIRDSQTPENLTPDSGVGVGVDIGTGTVDTGSDGGVNLIKKRVGCPILSFSELSSLIGITNTDKK
jgi:hypothetical protein